MPHVIPPLGLKLRVGPVVLGERPDPARPGRLKGLPGPGPPGQKHHQDEPQGEFADGRRIGCACSGDTSLTEHDGGPRGQPCNLYR